jgi:hypothetical protein
MIGSSIARSSLRHWTADPGEGEMETPTTTGPVPGLQVFLSYCTVEAKFADALKQHLVRDFIGLVRIFLASDTTSIPVGARWLADIIGGLHRSQLHVVICSKDSMYRPWINYEAGAAAVRDVPIIPLCHSGLVPAQLPVPLSESQGGVITDVGTLEKLYARIAEIIGSSVPPVDFDAYAAEFREIEEEFAVVASKRNAGIAAVGNATAHAQTEMIRDPNVLCVTSAQFKALGYENQLQIVLDAFPNNIRHQFVVSSAELSRILLEESVDIVHIAGFVCPRGGDLYFSSVELPSGASNSSEVDRLSADALVALLKRANARLVVLAGSASLVLAVQLLTVTNVIGARDMVSARAMASWVDTFYKTLTKETLAVANELASQVSQAPMKLYAQQRETPAMTVALSPR